MQSKKLEIAFIRTDLIGDFVLWIDAAIKLKAYYSDCKITFICNQQYFGLANSLNIFDNVLPLDVKKLRSINFKYWLNTITQLRKVNFNLILSPMVTRNVIVDGLIAASKAKQKIGMDGYYNQSKAVKKLFSYCYTRLISINSSLTHELEFNMDFVNQLCKQNNQIGVINLTDLFVSKLPKTNMLPANFIVFNLGTSVSQKNWTLTKFIKVIKELRTKYVIVLLGSQSEQDFARGVINSLSEFNIIDLTGKTSLMETIAILKESRLLVGNDSALAHLAVHLGVESVIIAGGGHFGRFLPYPKIEGLPQQIIVNKSMSCYHCNWCCKYPLKNASWRCIANIAVNEVLNAICYVLIGKR